MDRPFAARFRTDALPASDGSRPFVVAGALLLARLPDYRSGEVHADRALLRTGDAWYSIWPVLVLLAFGATSPDWSDWPIYLLALAAQFAIDGAMTTFRVSYGLGIKPRTVISELRRIDLIDALLSPAGLLVAFGAASEPWASILILPLLGVFQVFAKEREARIESAIALSGAYRGTAILLSEVLSSTDEYTGHHSRSVVVLAHQVGEALDLDEADLRDLEFGGSASRRRKDRGAKRDHQQARPAHRRRDGRHAHPHGRGREHAQSHRRAFSSRRASWFAPTTSAGTGRVTRTAWPSEEIPIGARVISACDAFNAMTTDRPYRKAMSVGVAVTELRSEAGKQFDPRVVEALVDLVESWDEKAGLTKAGLPA